MELKFLFGTNRVIKVGEKDIISNIGIKDFILLTRKVDILQHSDMKKVCCFSPSHGGFVCNLRKAERTKWYGESVSCRVDTDESMEELYHKLCADNNIYKFEHTINKSVYTIFAICPEGYMPSSLISEIKWEICSYNDLKEITKVEDDTGNW